MYKTKFKNNFNVKLDHLFNDRATRIEEIS